jgi:hypothetical protein
MVSSHDEHETSGIDGDGRNSHALQRKDEMIACEDEAIAK